MLAQVVKNCFWQKLNFLGKFSLSMISILEKSFKMIWMKKKGLRWNLEKFCRISSPIIFLTFLTPLQKNSRRKRLNFNFQRMKTEKFFEFCLLNKHEGICEWNDDIKINFSLMCFLVSFFSIPKLFASKMLFFCSRWIWYYFQKQNLPLDVLV